MVNDPITWRPAASEIDPLVEAVQHAARAAILPLDAIATPPPSVDGVRDVRLVDGRRVRIAVGARAIAQATQAGRAVATYEISGNAVAERDGYRVTGRAVVDLATRAFVEVNCRLEAVGAVGERS